MEENYCIKYLNNNYSTMNQTVFLVKWFGPFSQEEINEWEKEYGTCQLSLFGGMKKYAKTKLTYYCGVTKRSVSERFRDSNHHIKEIGNRKSSIYIGRISNLKHPTDEQNKLVEKMLTAYLDSSIGRDVMLNKTNFSFPKSNIYIINEWWKPYVEEIWQRQSKVAPSYYIPDVLCFHYFSDDDVELFGTQKLKKLF